MTLRSEYVTLGDRSTARGEATITGSGSQWINGYMLDVGDSGEGALTVEAGGHVSSTYSTLGVSAVGLGGIGVATVTGGGSQWTNSRDLSVGGAGAGTLIVEAGGQVSNNRGFVGSWGAGVGVATISGHGSLWTNLDSLSIGLRGSGALTVEAGGQVMSNDGYLGRYEGSTGVATITGIGSQWNNSGGLWVGREDKGTLYVEAGGLLTSKIGYVGSNFSGPKGVVKVTGSGSQWVNGSNLYIGYSSGGTLIIESGGQVTSRYGYLGLGSIATGVTTVKGNGSLWTSYRIDVAYNGDGKLLVLEGGKVDCRSSSLGYQHNGMGVATVKGSGSQWDSYDLSVGREGRGTLNIEDGGLVSSSYGYLGLSPGASGKVTILGRGSQWKNDLDLYVGREGSGSVTVADGGLVTTGSLWASLDDLYGDGMIVANGAILDADLLFDAASRAQAVLGFGSGGTLTVNASGGALGAGYKGLGSLSIVEGTAITSWSGWLGRYAGAMGVASVVGAGSQWISSYVSVGLDGNGVLNVEAAHRYPAASVP